MHITDIAYGLNKRKQPAWQPAGCSGFLQEKVAWRLSPESNRGPRLCRPLHNHSATQPLSVTASSLSKRKTPPGCGVGRDSGAGNEIRTRDPNLGKVVLYQLSYSRLVRRYSTGAATVVKHRHHFFYPPQGLARQRADTPSSTRESAPPPHTATAHQCDRPAAQTNHDGK